MILKGVKVVRGRLQQGGTALLLALALVVSLVFTQHSSAQKVFGVGFVGPFTGPAARTGDEFKASVNLALDRADHRVGDYRIEPVWIDSQSDPEKATRAYEEAVVGKGIQAGCLNWHSSVAVALMEVVARHHLPHFFGMGATDVVNQKFNSDREKYGYWMAKGWPVPAKLSIAYVQTLEEAARIGALAPSKKTAGIWGEDTDWGRSFGRAVRQQLEQAGWRVVAEEYFPINATEHYALLRKFKDLGAPVVIGTATAPPAVSAFIKQAREVGLDALIVADGLGWVGEWYKLTGPASDLVVDQIPQWSTKEALAWKDGFTKRFSFAPSPSAAGLAYDFTNFCLAIFQRTLAKYGALSSENVYKVGREELWTGKLTYTSGIVMRHYKYTPETIPDPVVGQGFYIFPVLQYSGGNATIIWPPEWKTGALKVK